MYTINVQQLLQFELKKCTARNNLLITVEIAKPLVFANSNPYHYLKFRGSRYPEAVAIKGMSAETVVEGILQILTDQGRNFTSKVIGKPLRLSNG